MPLTSTPVIPAQAGTHASLIACFVGTHQCTGAACFPATAASVKADWVPACEYVKESNPGLRLGFFHALAPKNDVCGRAEGKQSYPTTFYSTGEMLRKDFFTGSCAGMTAEF
jgi:hypothetical protein